MWKRLAMGMVVVGLLAAAACGGGKAKAQVFAVQVDGKTSGFAASFLAYFPNDVQAHPGDTVKFTSVFTGEPHTVTLGKDVDDVFALIAKACPSGVGAPPCDQGPPQQYADQYNALDKKLPNLLPEGSRDANQTAAQPCFLPSGDAPTDGSACSADQRKQSAFDGTQTFYNSGFLPDQTVFEVKLASNIAPGTYHYYCLLHRETMSGTITVVAKGTSVPSPDVVKKSGSDQLSALAAKIKPNFDSLASLKAENAQAGAGSPDVRNAGVDEFGPSEIDIPVGGSVTWTVLGPHTISFNAPEDAEPILTKSSDGSYHVNPKGAAPAGGPGQPTPNPNAPTPEPNAPPTMIDGGSWDGTSFHSSGIILSFPPQLYQYKLTFTKAGTYTVDCLIHPHMEAKVKVGP